MGTRKRHSRSVEFSFCSGKVSLQSINYSQHTSDITGTLAQRKKKNQISATRQMESEGIFLRWWHFSSLLYCDDSFDNTCPCFWQEQNFAVAAAKLIKKPQRSAVCHWAQQMGGAAVNKAAIILKSIWTRMVENRSLGEWDLIRVDTLSLEREHSRYKGSKRWMETGNSNNKALTQRNENLVSLLPRSISILRTNKKMLTLP